MADNTSLKSLHETIFTMAVEATAKELSNMVIILDTYKKFTADGDVNNKKANVHMFATLRQLTMKGATVLILGQRRPANKEFIMSKTIISLIILSLVLFATACSDSTGPETGTVVVTTGTIGPGTDDDGYIVILHGISNDTIGTNDEKTFTLVPPGTYQVELKGVDSHCHGTDNPRSVVVSAGGTATTHFEIECEGGTGAITVTTLTSGVDLDQDGYELVVDGTPKTVMTANAIYTIGRLAPGDHTVELKNVVSNCSVEDANPRTISVAAHQTADLQGGIDFIRIGRIKNDAQHARGKPHRAHALGHGNRKRPPRLTAIDAAIHARIDGSGVDDPRVQRVHGD